VRQVVNDPESGEHHLAHAGCCLVFLLWFEVNGRPAQAPDPYLSPAQVRALRDALEPLLDDDSNLDMHVAALVSSLRSAHVDSAVHIAKEPDLILTKENLKMPEGWNDPRQEPRDSDGREPEMTDDMQDDMQDGSRVIGYVPREDVGFALTDAEAAEAERAVDAEWGGELRRKLGVARGMLDTVADDLEEVGGWEETVKEIRQTLRETADMSDAPKPRPEGRGHLPIAYELDRAEAITARLRKENAQLKESFANLRKAHEENEDAVTKLQIEADTDYADAQANLDIEKKAHEITRGMLALSVQWISELSGDRRTEAAGANAVHEEDARLKNANDTFAEQQEKERNK